MNSTISIVREKLQGSTKLFSPVVDFIKSTDKLVLLDLSEKNSDLDEIDFSDAQQLGDYVDDVRSKANARYAIGGYNELRAMYSRSPVFDGGFPGEEPRRLHLGIDIWGLAGTPVRTPIGGMIHSFAFNDHYGDYGAAIILQHQIDTVNFYTLFGHLSVNDIAGLQEGTYITRGQVFAHFGKAGAENGHWPPHLHFQVIEDIRQWEGDYPGVCKLSERNQYLANSPDPDLILDLMKYSVG